MRELGKKFAVVDAARQYAESKKAVGGMHTRMDDELYLR